MQAIIEYKTEPKRERAEFGSNPEYLAHLHELVRNARIELMEVLRAIQPDIKFGELVGYKVLATENVDLSEEALAILNDPDRRPSIVMHVITDENAPIISLAEGAEATAS